MREVTGQAVRGHVVKPAARNAAKAAAKPVVDDPVVDNPAVDNPAADNKVQPEPAANPARTAARLPAGTIGEAVLLRLRQQADLLFSLESAVRADEPDSVHQMRVAARCLRSALKTYPGVLDAERTEALAVELKWLGEILGRARDNEVIGEILGSWAATQPELRARIETWYDSGYRSAWQDAVAELDSVRYLALLDSLAALVDDPPWGPKAKRRAVKALRGTVHREFRRTESRIELARAADPGPARDLSWHEARKAAKRARYAGETAAPVLGESARRFTRRMKEVQQVLGARQDTVVARESLAVLAARAFEDGQSTYGYVTLHADLAVAALHAEGLLGPEWKRVRRAVRAA